MGWTKRQRVEVTGHSGATRWSKHEQTCFVCESKIPAGAFYLRGSVQIRSYRSKADIGQTRGVVRICAACLFPATS